MGVDSTPAGDDETITLEPEPAAVDAVEKVDSEASAEVMSLLSEGVPLALLADLANPQGPESPAILEDEGLPDVAWWDAPADDEGTATDISDVSDSQQTTGS